MATNGEHSPEGHSGPVSSALEVRSTEEKDRTLELYVGNNRFNLVTSPSSIPAPWPSLPEGLADGVGTQVDDLDEVIPRAGEQLGAVVVQIQRRDLAQELQLTHDALRSAGPTPDTLASLGLQSINN